MNKNNKLSTIQKRGNLNTVIRLDERGSGGAHHTYQIKYDGVDYVNQDNSIIIDFQNGPRHLENSKHGVTDQDLLEIVRDRLMGFTNGDMPTIETEKALEHIEIALMYLNKRIEDRIERGVLGTYEK